MILKDILFCVLLLPNLKFHLIFCKSLLHPIEIDPNVTSISRVLLDITDEFLIKEGIKFTITNIFSPSQFQADVWTDFMAEANEKFDYFFLLYVILRPQYPIFHSCFLAIKRLDDFEFVDEYLDITRYQDQPIKYFIIILAYTFEMLNASTIIKHYKYLSILSNKVFHNAYFITNEMDTVTLSTVEWFTPNGCNYPQFIKLNTFHKKSMKWSSKLENYEKFLNYHGCELVMLLPAMTPNGIVNHVSGYSIPIENGTNFLVRGITPVVYEIASKFYNFIPQYQPADIPHNFFEYPKQFPLSILKINKTFKIPNVFFQVKSLHSAYDDLYYMSFARASNVIANLDVKVFVTPAEKYTPYEKFILPFDLETWILLIATFLCTFLCILVINRFSKSTQRMVYGYKVVTPAWNVISIIFGISQTRLPTQSFSRFILIIFLYFCLIFRTCFQSKFFEFMTSDPRRPPPKTLGDLISRRYSVFALHINNIFSKDIEHMKHWPDIAEINITNFKEYFLSQSQNSSAKMALCVDEYFKNFVESNMQRNHDWNILEDTVLYTTHEAFMFWEFSFYFRMLKKLINNIIPTGIMKYLVENYYTKKLKFAKLDQEPKVLSVDDLLFGFNIWLGSCLISFVAFVIERQIKSNKQKKRKIKFEKVHPSSIKAVHTCKLTPQLIQKFRGKRQKQKVEQQKDLDEILSDAEAQKKEGRTGAADRNKCIIFL